MKIVIDVPEEVKEVFDKAKEDDLNGSYYDYNSIIGKAIQNGTPLPKGHGRLCDMDAALKCLQETADCKEKQYAIGMLEWAMAKRTVIEADKEVKHE